MTRDRSFKRVVRTRMRRTGESYTAALARVQGAAPPSRPTHRGGSGMYPFERFTERAKRVLTLAQEEAGRAGHGYIDPEHLLIGLLGEEECLAVRALGALGVELESTRAAVQAALGTTPRTEAFQVVPTSRVKKVIEEAFEEAQRMGHHYVGTEHLLLGLLVEGDSIAARALTDRGVTLEKARTEVARLLEEGAQELTAAQPAGRRPGGPMPLQPDLVQLMSRARALAAGRRSPGVGVGHLLEAMASTDTGLEVLARLLDWRRLTAMKEQAIAAQDYEKAGVFRAEEQPARRALEAALTAFRQELEPPPDPPQEIRTPPPRFPGDPGEATASSS